MLVVIHCLIIFFNCYDLSRGSNRALSLAVRGCDLDTIGNEGINHETHSKLLNDPKLKVKMGYVGINIIIVDGIFELNITLIVDW